MRRLFLFTINNIGINWLMILLGLDHVAKQYISDWSKMRLNKQKTLQENAGFSHEKVVQEAVDRVHKKVQEAYGNHCKLAGNVLDIGCGPGLYLMDFPTTTPVFGTDLSEAFIKVAKSNLSNGKFKVGDFMKISFPEKFKMIFSISVLEYIPPSKLSAFFDKIFQELEPGGILLIQYPHAHSFWECLFPDLSYVQYGPRYVEKAARKSGFSIVSHKHSYDDRVLNFRYDSIKYDREMEKSFRNGAILIAAKNG